MVFVIIFKRLPYCLLGSTEERKVLGYIWPQKGEEKTLMCEVKGCNAPSNVHCPGASYYTKYFKKSCLFNSDVRAITLYHTKRVSSFSFFNNNVIQMSV